MRRIKKSLLSGSAVLFAGMLFCSFAFGASLEKPTADPPFGLKIEGAVAGTKLYGTIAFQIYQIDSNGSGKVRALLRVRKGSTLAAFFADSYTTTAFNPVTFACSNYSNPLPPPIIVDTAVPAQVQLAITCAMKNQVLKQLFNGDYNLQIYLKAATDFTATPVSGSFFTEPSLWDMVDVELAVN